MYLVIDEDGEPVGMFEKESAAITCLETVRKKYKCHFFLEELEFSTVEEALKNYHLLYAS